MGGLGLVENETVGYRIKPDWYSFNVVLVKRKGPNSRTPGAQYETTLAYCKNLEGAVQWLTSHAARLHGERLQHEQASIDGTVASAQALGRAIELAKEEALRAVAELAKRIEAAGLLNKQLVDGLGEAEKDAPDGTPA